MEEKYFSYSYNNNIIIAQERMCLDRNVLVLQQSIMTIEIETLALLTGRECGRERTVIRQLATNYLETCMQ